MKNIIICLAMLLCFGIVFDTYWFFKGHPNINIKSYVIISGITLIVLILINKAMYTYIRYGKVNFTAKLGLYDLLRPQYSITTILLSSSIGKENESTKEMKYRILIVVLIALVLPFVICILMLILQSFGIKVFF